MEWFSIKNLNNDNKLDIVVANSGTSNIFFLYGYGNGTFGNETFYPLGYDYLPYSVALKDLTQDNWLDIVIACYDTDHVETLIKMCWYRCYHMYFPSSLLSFFTIQGFYYKKFFFLLLCNTSS